MQLRSSVRRKSLSKCEPNKAIKKAKHKNNHANLGKKVLEKVLEEANKKSKKKKIDEKVKSVSFSNHSKSLSSSLDDNSVNSTRRSLRKRLIRRDISSEFSDFSITIEKFHDASLNSIKSGKGCLRSFDNDESFKKKCNVVASTPLPPQLRKKCVKTLETDLTGTYWSPKARVLKDCCKERSSRPKSCSTVRSIRRRSSLLKSSVPKSCPPKLTKRRRASKGPTPKEKLPAALLSENVPKKVKKKGKGKEKENTDIVSFYLSSTFTTIKKKNLPDLSRQNKSLLAKGLSMRACPDPNKTEISLLRKRKKLYSDKISVFTKSPADTVPKSILKSKRSNKSSLIKTTDAKSKGVRLKLPMDNVIETEKENVNINCGEEVNIPTKTGKVGDSHSNNELHVSDVDNGSLNKEDFNKLKFVSVNGFLDGTYEAPKEENEAENNNANFKCKIQSSDILCEIDTNRNVTCEPQKCEDGYVDVKADVKVAPSSETPHQTELDDAKTQQPSRKKKKLLQSKQRHVFDLEVENNEEELLSVASTTCNKTIMESALHMMH